MDNATHLIADWLIIFNRLNQTQLISYTTDRVYSVDETIQFRLGTGRFWYVKPNRSVRIAPGNHSINSVAVAFEIQITIRHLILSEFHISNLWNSTGKLKIQICVSDKAGRQHLKLFNQFYRITQSSRLNPFESI